MFFLSEAEPTAKPNDCQALMKLFSTYDDHDETEAAAENLTLPASAMPPCSSTTFSAFPAGRIFIAKAYTVCPGSRTIRRRDFNDIR